MEGPKLLPPTSAPLEHALEATAWAALDIPVGIADLWSADRCPEAFLPFLAWSFSVDDWDPAWPEATKREVIAASVEVHRHKGTLWSVRRALAAMGYGDCRITEGWQTFVGSSWVAGDDMPVGGAGHWAEYWITVSAPVTPAMVAAIRTRLASVAPARCRLTRIIVDAVSTVVAGPWTVGDPAITVGATYTFKELSDGILAGN